MKYKHIYAAPGLIFLIQAKEEDTDNLIFIKVTGGNLYQYLQNKSDNYRFTVKRVLAETEDSHIVINNIGEWINLSSR